MSRGICGARGDCAVDNVLAMSARIEHRGPRLQLLTISPELYLAQRGDDDPQASREHDEAPLVFAGTITNRAELLRDLGDAGSGAELNDEQLIWELYRARSIHAFERIDGSFAIALFDAHSACLVLAADRWGSQPLYFAAGRAGWTFASEYKALLGDEAPAPALDVAVAAYVLANKHFPAHRTLLSNVQAVGPGEFVRIRGADVRAASYSPFQLAVDECLPEEAHAIALREHILDAARRLVDGHDCVGIALSAGLDSTLTLGAIRAVAPSLPVYTYTASFSPKDPDLALAAEAARYFGTTHREIILSPEDLPELLPELIWRMEDPVAREEMVVYDAVAQRAAGETPLLLYGQMADRLFGGMPRHLLIKAASELPFARKAITEFYDYTQSGAPPGSLSGKLLVNAYYRGRRSRRPRSPLAQESMTEEGLRLAPVEPLNCALLAGIGQPGVAAAMERLHTWAGLRADSLFYGREVSRYAFRIPGKYKIRGTQGKHILRRAAENILPAEFVQRPKGLIRITRDARLKSALGAMGDELLSPAAVRSRGAFDAEDVAQLRLRVARARCTEPDFYYLWTLILFELWCRTYVDARGKRYRPAATRDSQSRPSQSARSGASFASPA